MKKTYKVTYTLEATVPVEAENTHDARCEFQKYTIDQLSCFAADSLRVLDVIEEGKEPEGLSKLKVGDMMSRATW